MDTHEDEGVRAIRGIINGVVLSVALFWMPLGITVYFYLKG